MYWTRTRAPARLYLPPGHAHGSRPPHLRTKES
jgi:hypothetical protein